MTTLPDEFPVSVTIERPALYLVATPIGNLGDMTLRAIEILKKADAVYAEDTRNTAHLLSVYGVARPLESLHDQNEEARVDAIITAMRTNGMAMALVSDAGTPLISDPGFKLVQAAHGAGIAVRAVPGASALLAAVTVAALTVDRFAFEGFLPSKSAARRTRLSEIREESHTTVFFEAPHRIHDTVADMLEVLGPLRKVCVARELTKQYETLYRGELQEVVERLNADPYAARGEIVIVIEPGLATGMNTAATKLLSLLLSRMTTRDAVDIVAEVTGVAKNLIYAEALARRDQQI